MVSVSASQDEEVWYLFSVWGNPNFHKKGNQHFLFNLVRFNCFLPPKTEVTQACNIILAFPITPHKVTHIDQ